jgi:hypothetical protein
VTAPPYYDNLGFGLLGTLVADIVGTPYRQAVHDLVFAPLGMRTAVAGLPPERVPDAAACHHPDSRGRPVVCPQGLIVDMVRGGGDISATAADLAQLMRALLVPGILLQPNTLAQLKHTDDERLNPLLPGLGLTLREADYARRRSLGHHGLIDGFNSEMALFPQAGLGIFISVNGGEESAGERMTSGFYGSGVATGAIDARPLVDEVIRRFALEFVPLRATRPAGAVIGTLETHEPPASALAGIYSRPDETRQPPGRTVSQPVRVGLIAKGQLEAYGCAPFVRKAPLYYECSPAVGDPIELGFARDAQGHILLGHIAIEALERQR